MNAKEKKYIEKFGQVRAEELEKEYGSKAVDQLLEVFPSITWRKWTTWLQHNPSKRIILLLEEEGVC